MASRLLRFLVQAKWLSRIAGSCAVVVGMGAALAPAAIAQVTYDFAPTGGAINASIECGVADLVSTVSVTETDPIADINLGFRATHTYRTDINISLTSPAGTSVDLLTGGFSSRYFNYDVLFDDNGGGPVVDTGSHANDDNTAAPFYDNNVLSEGDPLSDFNGENPSGTWTLRICDVDPTVDVGTFLSSQLQLSVASPTDIDLSLTLSPDTSSPNYGANVTYTVTVTNGGPAAASGVQAAVTLPDGLTYVSDTASGAYVSGTGVWTVGALAAGASTSFDIVATVEAVGSYTTTAEITAANETDADSTPGNASTIPGEDDTDSDTLTPQTVSGGTAGTPPTLSCASPSNFVLGDFAWSAGDETGSDTQNGDTLNITVSDPSNRLIASGGTSTPFLRNTASYGESPNPTALYVLANFANTLEEVTTTFQFGTVGVGIDAAQMRLFDVDYGSVSGGGRTFVDRITATATLGGVAVPVTLTQGVSNVVAGNSIYGTDAEGDTSSDATLFISSETPFDTLTLRWGAGPGSIANPNQQGIGFGDFTYCPRTFDFADAAGYGSASHGVRPGFFLGSGVPDTETGDQFTTDADGDDVNGSDDEDGVAFPTLTQGQAANLVVSATGTGGFLQGWIDFDGNGSFSSGEQVATDLQDTNFDGSITVPVTVPGTATTTQTSARFRWSPNSGLAATGQDGSGEVEDYVLTILPTSGTGTCPAGYQAVFRSGTADTVVTSGTDAQNPDNALGTPEAAGTNGNTGNSARIRNNDLTLILDLGEIVAGDTTLAVTTARDNSNGNMAVDMSFDGSSYTQVGTFNATPNDQLSVRAFTVPTGGAQFVRFRRLGGRIWIAGMTYSQACDEVAVLTGTKTVAMFTPGAYSIPGEDVVYTITFTNTGGGTTDLDSVEIIDSMPPDVSFYNADMDGPGGPATDPVGWVDNGTGLSLVYADDVAFSDAGPSDPAPTAFTDCGYTPVGTYDANVTYVCINPSGVMASGDPDPSFSVSFRARIQ